MTFEKPDLPPTTAFHLKWSRREGKTKKKRKLNIPWASFSKNWFWQIAVRETPSLHRDASKTKNLSACLFNLVPFNLGTLKWWQAEKADYVCSYLSLSLFQRQTPHTRSRPEAHLLTHSLTVCLFRATSFTLSSIFKASLQTPQGAASPTRSGLIEIVGHNSVSIWLYGQDSRRKDFGFISISSSIQTEVGKNLLQYQTTIVDVLATAYFDTVMLDWVMMKKDNIKKLFCCFIRQHPLRWKRLTVLPPPHWAIIPWSVALNSPYSII